ncbi:hypothetical protein EIN_469360 [Entamoeba invadens IP1]|uniref:Uncharacterized protein n=1 Tax=Entamoeba invadens IP1 TaxID=370355 RepID=A0A0A1TUJ4_ENTIV|nr:hypothetical protein EIN_469360 [Entamoeba invadens IP1]ELP83732.1 hypothetical protein EIN_469360 [Entamoeba invadens IP1]|eukprot:XP_004183078.1 hypothetical protein EIN_469360 [Entamoeba invadens IP1]
MANVQIHLRLVVGLIFRKSDPLPTKYLNSIAMLLNVIREVLDSTGAFLLFEYFKHCILEMYPELPVSVKYLHAKIDSTEEENFFVIDDIIQRNEAVIQKDVPQLFDEKVVIKKESFADLFKNKRKAGNKQIKKNEFMFVAMEE